MPAISEARFDALKTKLRELFELDKSDLDFGIYRIMAAKNAEVNEFLDQQLKVEVKRILHEHGGGAAGQVEKELAEAVAQAQGLGVDPEQTAKVRELRARLTSEGTAGELEADIYNHLLAFFGRYYDEGDFISQRRHKGDVYAIPYAGEEVALHWANKDQYYIKSGEWHKDYRFKIGEHRVHFKLVEATQEAGNNKETEKRRFILASEAPVEANAGELTLRFEYRVPTEKERKRAAGGCVAIFGGKYEKGTKGDEREQFYADAEHGRSQRCRSSGGSGWPYRRQQR